MSDRRNEMSDDFGDFTADDLPMLNVAMRAFPHVGDGFRAVVNVSSRLNFPVESTEELQKVISDIGGIRYADTDIPIEDLPTLMPAYYFPVESVEDFFAKVSDVATRVREPDGPGMATTRLIEAVAPLRKMAGEAPSIRVEEIRRRVGLSDTATPSVGGIPRYDD